METNKPKAASWSLERMLLWLAVLVLIGTNAYYFGWVRQLTSVEGIVENFHVQYYYDKNTWQTMTWLGVPCQQNPNDVWIHQEIIHEVKPDFVIEAGTFRGGSALIWAMILAQVNPEGRVITIDVLDLVTDAKQFPIWKERVDVLQGSSTDPKIVAEVEKRVKGKKVVVILDSVHIKEHVLAELDAYSPLIPVGSYLIVQDTNLNGHPVLPNVGPHPLEAVLEWLPNNPNFISDRTKEKLLFTMHPMGYLKRIK